MFERWLSRNDSVEPKERSGDDHVPTIEAMGIDMEEEAYTAGLFHDIGKLVLVTNFGGEYQKALEIAHNEKIAMWTAERIVFGCSHAEAR